MCWKLKGQKQSFVVLRAWGVEDKLDLPKEDMDGSGIQFAEDSFCCMA